MPRAPPTAPSRSMPSWPKPMRRARRPRSRRCPGPSCRSSSRPQPCRPMQSPLEPLWFMPATGKYNEGNKHFIDFQNDVKAADLELAQREGYEVGRAHQALHHLRHGHRSGQDSQHQRPRRLVGSDRQDDPRGRHHHLPPALHALHLRRAGRQGSRASSSSPSAARRSTSGMSTAGAHFEPVGQWRRAYCYPGAGERQAGRSTARSSVCGTRSACSMPPPSARS